MATTSSTVNTAPSVTRARLSTSVEPTGMAGTSWNSVRWARPSSGYRTGRLANTFERTSPCSSVASSCSSTFGAQSPHQYTLPSSLRSSERASSAATRPNQNDTGQIRANSRYGASYLNSSSTSNGSTATSTITGRTAQSASSALSPRQEPQRKSYPYRTMGLSQPRATLLDIRQNLRPVKRHTVTDYKSLPRTTLASTSSTAASTTTSTTPLTLFTNAQIRTSAGASHHAHHQSAISPISKCVSPFSPTMSRSSSTVTSPIPITKITPRPIPKSERPWRQKLADAQRLREAQAERTFGNHIPMEPYDTTARIMAARSARRASVEQQQTQKQQCNEQQLEKEIAALKCYVSEPGALDKNATVAKFRQRMAESQIAPSLATPSSSSAASSAAAALLSSASSLLSRMPSLSRRSTTAVTKDLLPAAQQTKGKERPLSMVETPFGQRRLSIVCESAQGELPSPTADTPTEKEAATPTIKGKTKESPKTQKKTTTLAKEQPRPASRTSTASTVTAATTVTNAAAGGKAAKDKADGAMKKTDGNGTALRRRKKEAETEQKAGNKNGKEEIINKKEKLEKQEPDDEKQFNAIVQFKPQSMLCRKISAEEEKEKKFPRWRKTSAAERPRNEHEESPKPVPGTWERTPKERFISHNKHLIRKSASESAVHVHKIRSLARVNSVRMRAHGKGGKAGDDNQSIKSQQISVKAKGSPTATVLKMIKSIAKPKQRVCAVAVLDKQLANKRSFRLGVRKTLLLKNVPQKLCAQLRCRSAQLVATTVRFNIVWKEQRKTANVTILLADLERITSMPFREPASRRRAESKSQSPLKRIQQELDKENMASSVTTTATGRPIIIGGKGGGRQQQQQSQQIPSSNRQHQLPAGASLVAAAAGNIVAAAASLITQPQQPKAARSTNYQTVTIAPPKLPSSQPKPLLKVPQLGEVPLILPDHSVLEQFVQDKRDALNRLHEEAEGILDQTRALEAPRPPAHLSPSATASLPGSKRNSQMLATAMHPAEVQQLPQSLSNSFHAAVQATAADLRAQQQQQQMQPMARLRRPPDVSRATLSTQQFDKPKSLFEEQMQRQAIQMHQKAVRQSLHEPSAIERAAMQQQGAIGLARRRSAAAEHADVAQTFVAQAQKPFQSEQRYAAHIPLSGRQSTASIESANSSALDAATRQLDQMIDQARFKHSQQRNKFKEAIDYLDHIFEDFQREAADIRQPPAKKPASQQPQQNVPIPKAQQELQQPPIEPIQATFRPGNVKSAKEAFEKVAAAIASEKKASGAAKLKKQISAPTTSSQPQKTQVQQQKPFTAPKTHQKPEPFPVIVHPPSTTTLNEPQEEDVDVAETIVLPSKNTADRLDFTKSWLASGGDVRTWAESSPIRRADKLLGHKGAAAGGQEDECYDSDEHSLGSCSAEVAAINAANERRQRQKMQQQPVGQQPMQSTKNGQQKAAATAKKNGTDFPQKAQKNGTTQQQLRQKQPPSVATSGGTSTVPPPQIATAPAQPSTGAQGTLRPQPYRPQPQLGVLPPGLTASGQMHKVPSIEQLGRLRASQERACSQDYQSMGSSVHSQEGFRPQATYLSTHSLQRIGLGSGAFHSYTPTMLPAHQQHNPQQHQQPHGHHPHQLQLKGSIQSLPDSALCTAPNPAMNLLAAPAGAEAAGLSNGNYNNGGGGGNSSSFPHQQQPTSRQFATLARMDNNTNNGKQYKQKEQPNYQQRREHHQKQQPPAVPAHQSGASMNEHALAIDALVAELELNTDAALTTTEKRRSFPTMQTEVARAKASCQAERDQEMINGKHPNSSRRQQNGRAMNGGSITSRSNTGRPLEELSELLADQNNGVHRKHSGNSTSARPFDTINQEKLNPSKVDAMARIFDNSSRQQQQNRMAAAPMNFTNGPTNSNGCTNGDNSTHTWTRRAATIGGRIPSNHRVGGAVNQRNGGNDYMNGHEGSAEYQVANALLRHASQPQQQQSPRVIRGSRPTTKAPTAVPLLMVEKSNRQDTPIMTDQEEADCNGNNGYGNGNGFYENVQRQRLRPSPGYFTADDCSSLSSQPGSAVLPPSAASKGGAGGRIGQLIRKLGNVGGGKPPMSVASMVSLNRVSNEPIDNGRSGGDLLNGGGMTKANSLSGEPWKCQVLSQQNGGGMCEDKPQHNGIGNRLKQTIFGGMVRRRVPT